MPIDTVRAHPDLQGSVHDDLNEIKQHTFKRYASPWTRIDAAASVSFQHGLRDFPHVAQVLEATDAQGSSAAEASSVTVTKTVTVVTVANGGTARFFRVRAF
jgi:hypothetical protein